MGQKSKLLWRAPVIVLGGTTYTQVAVAFVRLAHPAHYICRIRDAHDLERWFAYDDLKQGQLKACSPGKDVPRGYNKHTSHGVSHANVVAVLL
jgi:hypothetical protein